MRLIDADSITEKIMNVFEEALRIALKSGTFDLEGVMLKIKCYLDNEPIAYDVDKVVEKIDKDINWYQFLKDNLKCNGTVITSNRGVITTKQAILQNVKDIIKTGGIDE